MMQNVLRSFENCVGQTGYAAQGAAPTRSTRAAFICIKRIDNGIDAKLVNNTDEIKWNIVGREELVGREAVFDRCDKSAKFLKTVSPTITKLKINCAETFVVVEGAAQFLDQENQTSSVTSCDIFLFSDGRLFEITSYVVDLNKP